MLLSRFREQLRSSEWAERDRVPLTAGLAILQVIAHRVDSHVVPDKSDVDMARSVVETLPADSQIAEALAELLQVIDEDLPRPAGPALMRYGKTLEESGAYAFAADVYQLAAELGRREHGLVLVPAALSRVGFCLRYVGRLREATTAYCAAIVVAQETGDRVTAMLAGIGLANVDIAKNRYDSARLQLDTIISTARRHDARHPLAMALHDRAALANHEGDLEGAFIYLEEALRLVREPARKVRLLNDLGNLLRALGMPDVAREAFECVRAEGGEADVRWSATINLLAVAGDQEQWEEFDLLRNVLAAAALPPRMLCEFLDTVAEGLTARGDAAGARDAYYGLGAAAARHELPEFEAVAVEGVRGQRTRRLAPKRRELPLRCQPTIEAIKRRRALVQSDAFDA